jgi:ABC-type dipeptide/oligopeptide/nickel transport system ATPase subunit
MGTVAVFFGEMMAEDMGTVDVAGMEIAIKVGRENMRVIIRMVPRDPRSALNTNPRDR